MIIQNLTENDIGAAHYGLTPASVGTFGFLTMIIASIGLWGFAKKVLRLSLIRLQQ